MMTYRAGYGLKNKDSHHCRTK